MTAALTVVTVLGVALMVVLAVAYLAINWRDR